jgi:hypothetical protein
VRVTHPTAESLVIKVGCAMAPSLNKKQVSKKDTHWMPFFIYIVP